MWRSCLRNTLAPGALCAALSLSLFSVSAQAGGVRIVLFEDAAMAQLTHTTCAVTPRGRESTHHFWMVEGPACPLGGGACRHVAVLKINGKTVTLPRVDGPRRSVSDAWVSKFKLGEMTLSIQTIPEPLNRMRPTEGRQYSAVMIFGDGGGTIATIKGLASCEEG